MELIPLDPQWRCVYSDGSVLDLVRNVEQMQSRLDEFTGSPACGVGYQKFMKLSRRLHDISDRYFFYKPIGGLKDMFDWKGSMKASALGDVLSMRMGRGVASTVRSHIPDERVSQMMEYAKKYALGNLFLLDDTKDSDATNDHTTNYSAKPGLSKKDAAYERVVSYITGGGDINEVFKKYSVSSTLKKELENLV